MLSKNEIRNLANLKQRKYREKESEFLIEGFHLVDEILKSNYHLRTLIVRNDTDFKEHQNIFSEIKRKKIRVESVPAKLYDKLSETKNSQGVIGVAVRNSAAGEQNILDSDIILALDSITDPGNLGTI